MLAVSPFPLSVSKWRIVQTRKNIGLFGFKKKDLDSLEKAYF